MKKKIYLTVLLLIAVFMFASCAKKSETQTATSSNPHLEILTGDLSAFAGTWVNGDGERVQLKADGMWGDDGIRAFDFKRTGEGADAKYSWNVLLVENDERLGDIYIVLDLFPSGVDNDIRGEYLVDNNLTQGIFPTDNTKDRIVRTASIMSDSPFISSSVYYREGKYPAVQPQSIDPDELGGSYVEILNGDLSAFTGTWVNGRGERRQLRANGTFNAGETAYGFKIGNENDQHITGTYYQWIVNMGGEAGGFEVWLYPADVAVRNYIEDYGWDVVATHITMDRIFVESVGSSYDVYYREGELHPPSDDFVLGTWMFESGRNVYFFGESPSIHFLTDKTVNVYEQGDPHLRLARSGIWGYTPEGRLFVEYDWNTYYFLFSSDMENLIIIDSDGNRGVFGKVYG